MHDKDINTEYYIDFNGEPGSKPEMTSTGDAPMVNNGRDEFYSYNDGYTLGRNTAKRAFFGFTFEGKPSYTRGEDLGCYIWRDDSWILMAFSGQKKRTGNHRVFYFDVIAEGGEITNVRSKSWNDPEWVRIGNEKSWINGGGWIGPGDDIILYKTDADVLELDIQFSEPIVSNNNKMDKVRSKRTVPHPDLVFIGSQKTNPNGNPFRVDLDPFDSHTETPTETTDTSSQFGPGFGPLETVAGVAGAGYLLHSKLSSESKIDD